ncbi:MAG: type II secretion system F family protein [Planctomycetota bacterium]|nr:type II secretion system F family protein [Planctomycetota bacterium]
MADFKYVGRDKNGKTVSGTLTAETEADAKEELRKREYVILSISEKTKREPILKLKGAPKARVKAKELAVFTRQLATMISAGIPMLESVEVLADQTDDPGFKSVLNSVSEDVRAGTDFSEFLFRHPAVFKDLYINMVRAGEMSGKLDEILNRLAEYLEATEALRQEIKSAMTYPVVSLTMIVGIAGFLMLFIVPKFKDMFKQLRMTDLPLPTKVMFGLSDFLRTEVKIWVPALFGIIILLFATTRGSKGSYFKDLLLLKLPILGVLFHKVALSRFARTFATLLQSGVPILATLDIVASTTGNKVLEEAISNANKNIQEGDPLAVPLAKSGVFPKMVTRMISIGERSGALETLLEKISDFYDLEVRTTVKQLTSLIEPLMIGLMGIFVGGIVMAVFLPIFAMAGAVGKR